MSRASGGFQISLLVGCVSIEAFARFCEVSLEPQPVLGIHGDVFLFVAGIVIEACLADDVDDIGQDLVDV